MKHYRSTLVGLFFMGALAACGSKDSKSSDAGPSFVTSKNSIFRAKVEWPEALKASQGENNSAVVTIVKPDGEMPKEVSLTGFHPHMPAHGHGTEEKDQKIAVRVDEPNVFDVSGINFIMAGEATTWVTTIAASVDGQTDEAEVPVSRDVE